MRRFVNKCFVEQKALRQILANAREHIVSEGSKSQEVWVGFLASYLERFLGSQRTDFGSMAKTIRDSSSQGTFN